MGVKQYGLEQKPVGSRQRDGMTEEERFVVGQFEQKFLNSGKRIVIYGTGKHTRLILEQFPQSRVLGLMDAACKEPVLYGKRLLREEEVKGGADIILVVARRAVHGIIYPRIRKFRDYGIKIVDIEGKDIGEEAQADTGLPEWGVGFGDIKKGIDCHECISFDLFDTLLVRRYLVPDDVPKTAAMRAALPDAGLFERCRHQAEADGAALKNMEEIYEETAAGCGMTKEQAHVLKKLEFEAEMRGIAARRRVAGLLDYARSRGKKIFILTDMYYGKKQLKRLCDCAGIAVEEDEILSSCEMRASKESGDAYAYLKSRAGTCSVLHIGDHAAYDCGQARAAGIDAARILSSYEMLAHSSLSGMLSDTRSYAGRCCMGLAAARLWNDPFALNERKGRVFISDLKAFGYFMGAVFYSFACWLVCQARERGIGQMLLPGRDGWLVKKILDIMKPDFRYIYIPGSRRAYKAAVLKNEDDVRQVLDEDFKGSVRELYAAKFHVSMDENESEKERFRHVLQEASYQRQLLAGCLERSGVRRELRTGVFDCVAAGTVQSCLEKLLGIRTQGFYFGTVGTGKEHLEIHSAFGALEHYKHGPEVLEHYLFIENLLAEKSGTFIGFEDGKMIFEDNEPPEKLMVVQEGILDFVGDAIRIFGSLVFDPEYCNRIVGAVFSGKVEIAEEIREIFCYDDSYLGEKERIRIWQ